MGDSTIISKSLESTLKQIGYNYFEISEVTAEEFYYALKDAKQHLEYSACVHLHTIEEYREMRTYLSKDKKSGIAIEKDNNIVSIFNASDRKHMIRVLLPIALEKGGNKLDNFNTTKLSIMYSMYGFIPVTQTRFDDKEAPDDWNYDRDDRPEIIFWMHNGMSAVEIIKAKNRLPMIPVNSAQMFDTYEEARECRDKILEARNMKI